MRVDVLTALADEAAAVTGGCGATMALWPRAGVETVLVASHPELGELVELEHFLGDGPGLHALRSEHPVRVPDLVHDPRWTRLGREALTRGLRACVAAAGRGPGATAVITVYGLRPGEPGEPVAPFVASLARQAAWLSAFADTGEQHEREVRQLRQTMEGRETIEQAKGMIMQALGVDAEQAFAELRRTSQNAHMKLRDVAERLIAREI
ncbi:GAF and ANTAR domain-containing protein [Herbidospora sp. NBRC 101105]|uniref:GAF and ANTAR domain-containing protein n=1 Tax=Herbidospora sp. NBRC 101105 TaxID=3032195 RepID=UPI0024A0A121|nr:GAF and ANTAR domain-containing protein [Herbidospora sp. NBRC 101105]GLX95101.1 transcriptional regulator [Herbidospora sp. NBRC 101105]